MKIYCLSLLFCMLLTVPAKSADIPSDLYSAMPQGTEELVGEDYSAAGFSGAIGTMLETLGEKGKEILRSRLRGAASVLLVAVFCAAVGTVGEGTKFLPAAGGLAVTMLSAGSLEDLIGLGAGTISQLNRFSKVLLPTLAASAAVSGSPLSASMQQVTAVFLVGLVTSLISGLLLPLTYLYIGVLSAGSCLQEPRLAAIAKWLKGIVTWSLTTTLLLFTTYLSVAHVLTGATDAAAVKMTKTAISASVPVVGSVISDAAETVLAGAALVKNTIGIYGVLVILAAVALPFLHLGIQYLLYKAAAFLSAAMGVPWLSKLIDGLGGAFGLVLGMTGGCAVLLLVSVLCFLRVVTV